MAAQTIDINTSGGQENRDRVLGSGFMHALLLIPGVLGWMAWLHAQQAPVAPTAVPSVSFAPAVNYAIGGRPRAIAAGDFNGDGHVDLAVLRDEPGGVDILLGGTNGAFRLAQTLSMPYYWTIGCSQLVVGDLNSDGNLDLAIAQTVAGAVRVFLGDGTGCFEAAEDYTFANAPIALAVADFNGDGKLDLAFANADAGTQLGILLGQGAGALRHLPPQPVVAGAGTLLVGDFDGDGIPDLVMSGPGQDRLCLLRGQGDGTFLPEERVEAKVSPVGVACGDFNGDGKLDLVTANWERDSVSIFLGRGDGTFQAPVEYPAGNLPLRVAVADLNKDGKPDLIMGHDQSSDVSVLMGVGDGSFDPPLSFPALSGVSGMVVADFNGDGLPDVAVASRFDQNFVVLLNTTELGSGGSVHAPPPRTGVQPEPVDVEALELAIIPEEKPLTDYRISTWTTDQGLPQNTIYSMLQTDDGYLWIGTQSGLARFDGLHFKVFDRANTAAFKSDNVLCLAQSPDKALWIGTAEGCVRLRDRQFTHISTAPHNHVWAICSAGQNGAWLGAEGMLAEARDNNLEFMPQHPVGMVRSLLEDNLGQLYVGADLGLFRRSTDGHWSTLFRGETAFILNAATALTRDKQGRFWFGNDDGLWRWHNGQLKRFNSKQGLFGRPTSIAEDARGGLWLISGGRLNFVRDGTITRFSTAGLPDADLTSVCLDREGNIWLGTDRAGLVRLSPRRLVTYTVRDGLVSDDVWSICEGRHGEVWIGARTGISRFDGKTFTNFPSAADVEGGAPVWWDNTGTLWAQAARVRSGRSASLLRLQENHWNIVRPELSQLFQFISTIYQDREGAIWVASAAGLGRWRAASGWNLYVLSRFTSFVPPWTDPDQRPPYSIDTNSLPGSRGLAGVLEDFQGNVYVGSSSGLHQFRDGRFTTLSNGLTSNLVGPLLAEPDGTLWIGSDKGLNRLQNGQITRYTIAQGLAENLVANLLQDDEGWFWTIGHHGIHRMLKKELNEVAQGKRDTIRTISYGEADGMLSSEGNLGKFPNTCQTADGLLWFPTTRGIVVIEPHEMATHDRPAPVVIEQVLADDQVIFADAGDSPKPTPHGRQSKLAAESIRRRAGPFRVAPGRGRLLEFHYTANTFVAPEKVRFKYKLDGRDADWRDAGTRRWVPYTDLNPGSYRFRVMAITTHGTESECPAPFSFFIEPYVYQTRWFQAVSVLGLLLSGLGLHRVRMSILARRQTLEQQLALALQRERIAKDMHDDLGASLTEIGLLSDHARRDPNKSTGVAADVEKIADAARHTAQAADEIVWTVNPRHDTLDSLATYLCQFAREYLEPSNIRCRLDVPGLLPDLRVSSEVRHNLVLFVKEALNNAVKHSAAQQITVGLRLEGDRLTITVTDDGHGFAPQAASPNSPRGSHGNGLGNMRHRIESIGGQFELRSQPGQGVTVEATVRLVTSNQ